MYLRSATTLCFYLFGPCSARLHNIVTDAITLTSDQPQSEDMVSNPVGEVRPFHRRHGRDRLGRGAPGGGGVAVNWPDVLIKPDSAIKPGLDFLPTTTTEAAANGWMKSDEPCDPLLGEAWLYGGERTKKYSAAVYFTPEVGDIPGVVSAIEADYYGPVEKNLIGKYFSEEKTSKKDGSYRSISVALRNGKEENLCDKENPVTPGNAPYVKVSPGMANVNVPVVKDSPELKEHFKEGSCITFMGTHWAKDIVGGNVFSYKAENFFPIVPMYSSTDNTINGIFFTATSKKQTVPKSNMWDGHNLLQINHGDFFMCGNFCDSKCHFKGTADGYFTTMHWFFKNTAFGKHKETCNGRNSKIPFCKNGDYPTMAKPTE